MKAVVVEIRDRYAAVLSDDGSILTVKNKDYETGQILQLQNRKNFHPRKLAALVGSAAAFLIFGISTWAYATPYTYVSVDVNPSIEYTVNRFDRVLSVQAINDDGEEIVNEISLDNLKNKNIEDAIKKTIRQISESGYFDDSDDNGIIIATASENDEKADLLAANLQDATEEEIEKTDSEVAVESYHIGLDRIKEARELGVTPGKLNLVEKLQSTTTDSSEIDIKEWLDKPVREILKATEDNLDASAANEKATSQNEQEVQNNKKDKLLEEKEQTTAAVKESLTDATDDIEESSNKKSPVEKDKKDKIKSSSKNTKESSEAKSNKAMTETDPSSGISDKNNPSVKKSRDKAPTKDINSGGDSGNKSNGKSGNTKKDKSDYEMKEGKGQLQDQPENNSKNEDTEFTENSDLQGELDTDEQNSSDSVAEKEKKMVNDPGSDVISDNQNQSSDSPIDTSVSDHNNDNAPYSKDNGQNSDSSNNSDNSKAGDKKN